MILRDKQGRFLKKAGKKAIKAKPKVNSINLYDLHEMISAEVAFQLRGIQKSKPKSWWSLK